MDRKAEEMWLEMHEKSDQKGRVYVARKAAEKVTEKH